MLSYYTSIYVVKVLAAKTRHVIVCHSACLAISNNCMIKDFSATWSVYCRSQIQKVFGTLDHIGRAYSTWPGQPNVQPGHIFFNEYNRPSPRATRPVKWSSQKVKNLKYTNIFNTNYTYRAEAKIRWSSNSSQVYWQSTIRLFYSFSFLDENSPELNQ